MPFRPVFAFETDQSNLPEKTLADIGDEAFDYAQENIAKAINKINARIFNCKVVWRKLPRKRLALRPKKRGYSFR